MHFVLFMNVAADWSSDAFGVAIKTVGKGRELLSWGKRGVCDVTMVTVRMPGSRTTTRV